MESSSKPDYIGHRQRVKEKYKTAGMIGWHDYEILEFALSYALPRKDTKSIAKELLDKFNSFNEVLNADKKDLEEIIGISEHSILFIKLLKDIAILYMEKDIHNKDLISSPESVYNYLKASLKGLPNEEFKALFLNNRNFLQSIETIQTGTVNKSVVYPRQVVERALHNHSSSIIIAHNHPAKSIEPSNEDKKVTKLIEEALKTVEINLLDHIIIGGNNYFSFKENGLI